MKSAEFWQWFDGEPRTELHSRGATFAKMFEHLDTLEPPFIIVETGCVRKEGSWNDGQSTVLFDHYADTHPGVTVYTVDINPEATALCQRLVGDNVKIWTGDSVKCLSMLSYNKSLPPIGLLYLDSFDLTPRGNPVPSALHHLNEFIAILPALRPETMVAVDDSPPAYDNVGHLYVSGKGMFVAYYAAYAAANVAFSEYQVGWTNIVGNALELDVESLIGRARYHMEAGNTIAAGEIYRLILGRTTPPKTGVERVAHGEACAFFARCELTRSRFGAAADWYRLALDADPLATDYRIELCIRAFLPMGAIRQAKNEAERATRISPDNPDTWRALGGFEHDMGNVKGCIAAYDKQLALCPDGANALLDRATIALDVADYDRVRILCQRVLDGSELERHADAWHCLGMVAYREGRHEEAILLYDKAIAGNCHDVPIAHWNRALSLHSIGRYKEGWAEHEYREFQRTNIALALPMRRFTLPRWKGEPAPAMIHVHHEAGMGDNLCLARYLPIMVERGYTVRYETHESMVDIMRLSFPQVEILLKAADYPGALGIHPFDYHTPIGSLPAVFETEVETIPWRGPYLKADPAKAVQYEGRLPLKGRRIGLCWSSGIREGIWIETYGKHKSMSFESLTADKRSQRRSRLPIFDNNYCFVSLQVGPERAEHKGRILDLLPEVPTWAETAALVECLDLVITVDTAVAHLAGAMGKPVWLMLHTEGSWHWMAERPDASWNTRSPWYPSVRIFRQKRQGEWHTVLADIVNELEIGALQAAE